MQERELRFNSHEPSHTTQAILTQCIYYLKKISGQKESTIVVHRVVIINEKVSDSDLFNLFKSINDCFFQTIGDSSLKVYTETLQIILSFLIQVLTARSTLGTYAFTADEEEENNEIREQVQLCCRAFRKALLDGDSTSSMNYWSKLYGWFEIRQYYFSQ
jgi:hypothetical protein